MIGNDSSRQRFLAPSTGPHPPTPSLDDPRVIEALEEYMAAAEEGRAPNRQAFLARHADIAEPLAECLAGLEVLQEASSSRSSASEILASALEAPPCTPLGDFRIVREIGRGGMGVVYEAEQFSLGRRVALKVLPFAAALDAKQLQRFKNEATAAAHLHHPNIVPVYYVGVERSVHFYAMQLIEGRNLASVIEELRCTEPRRDEGGRGKEEPRTPGSSSSILPPSSARTASGDTRPAKADRLSTERSLRPTAFFRTAAGLALQTAAALDHAHGLGIIHRDIKPANLLVDTAGTVWVTDFGLAQFQNDGGLTQTGDLLGTLRYMSPEQAGGQRVLIDHRTDVYSLGATLYELLTLRPIFDGGDRQRLLHQILHEEPKPPRAFDRTIPVELETVVLKAVAKVPSERYATAREFGDDLQRFLDDRPIHARPPTVWDKATKWARRHRAVVGSAVVALLLSVAGLSVSTVLAARAYERERLKAEEAEVLRARAEESFRQARQAVDQFAEVSDELAGNPFLERPRRRLLEVALNYYQDFLDQRHDDPRLQAELEVSRDKVETYLRELTTLLGAGQYSLLQKKPVQEELGLSPAQCDALREIHDRWDQVYRDRGRLGKAEWERRRLDLARDYESEVAKLLTPAEMRRFKEIALQQRGIFAFSDSEVVAALKLTAEQKKRIREVQDEVTFSGPRSGGSGGRPPESSHRGQSGGPPPERSADEWRRAVEEARRIRERVLELLAPEQRRKWEELTGKPFEADLRTPRRPAGPNGN